MFEKEGEEIRGEPECVSDVFSVVFSLSFVFVVFLASTTT